MHLTPTLKHRQHRLSSWHFWVYVASSMRNVTAWTTMSRLSVSVSTIAFCLVCLFLNTFYQKFCCIANMSLHRTFCCADMVESQNLASKNLGHGQVGLANGRWVHFDLNQNRTHTHAHSLVACATNILMRATKHRCFLMFPKKCNNHVFFSHLHVWHHIIKSSTKKVTLQKIRLE